MSQKQTGCEYILHDEGIHELLFHSSSHRAVDEFMELVGAVFETASKDEAVRIVIDLSKSGLPSLRYAMGLTKQKTSTYFDNHADDRHHIAYIALVSSNSIIQTFKFFMEQLARGNTRIKICKDADTALAWLTDKQLIQERS
ncbi:MAG: hypothetical protein RLP44_21000 [Aggregatilineales bacterium]